MQELEQLKRVVLGDGWDAEVRQDVANLERRLQKAIATEKLAAHPVVAEYLTFLTQEIARCKELLSEDDKLTEAERTKLFEKIRQCREFLGRLVGHRAEVENTIKDMLDETRRYD